MATSISQYGITWSFDKSYQYGQYANGDYWVLGPTTIVSMSPSAANGKNGWEVNPVTSGGQALDGGANAYEPSRMPNLPYTAQPGQSVVKGISRNACGVRQPAGGNVTCLLTAAVLTVVDVVPRDNGRTVFRPPYVGSSKPVFLTTDMHTELIPSLAVTGNVPAISEALAPIAKLQMDHKPGVMGGQLRPENNIADYGGYIAVDINNAMARLMLNDPLVDKMPLAIAIVQAGIDRHYAVLSGQTWPDGNGHEPGRKLAIAFAALMLNNDAMKNTVSQSKFFSEDKGIQPGKFGRALFGFDWNATEAMYWEYVANPPNQYLEYKDPYGYIDGGSNLDKDIDGYQFCCLSLPWKGAALALHMMPEMQQFWGNALFLNYVDRYVSAGTLFQPDPCAPPDPIDARKSSSQWKKYGVTWGSDGRGDCIKDTNAADGTGRFPSYHGKHINEGYYSSALVETLWSRFLSR